MARASHATRVLPDMSTASGEMIVLHLIQSLDVGGLEQVVVDLVNGTNQTDQGSCHLGCLSHPGSRFDAATPAGTWLGSESVNYRFCNLGILRSLIRYLRQENIQIIHSHNPVPHRYAVLSSLLTGIPVVHTKHGRNYPDDPKAVWLNRLYARFTRKIIAVSADAAKVALDVERVPSSKVVTIVNGVDTDRFSPVDSLEEKRRLRRERNIPEEAFVVGSVGRFSPEKNYPLLVRALRELIGKCEHAFLVLVGDGPERDVIEAAVEDANVSDHCLLPGMRDDTGDWFHCMDVFCLSSLTEGTSITLLEAGACGLPSVVTDVGGNREVISDGVGGVVCPSGDARQLSLALTQLSIDGAAREHMGGNARHRVESCYSLQAALGKYADVYRSVLAPS